ncbi:flagellar hook-length control protein FliK [Sphingopyxis indica]|uniref:Flagellar hook-length control protein FliK n=1 Tax=Sphingopyxis indica TaxID=436663 RepID=A0A239JE92_9SPHN|nr:flagellar hook-length control protein FliK [Sphingopyxis indica]SNT04145.1 flagellar hook-length control protein FliK [Sphingopyxis indica]
MMNALPQQTSAQGGLMAVLAGLGAKPTGGSAPAGFEALFADMPLAEGVSPLPAEALQQFRRAVADEGKVAPAGGEAAPADTATPQTRPAATGNDAAAAAALLIRIATGAPAGQAAVSTPAATQAVAGKGKADSDESGEVPVADEEAAPANPLLALATPVAADPAKPVQAQDAKPEEAPALPRPAKHEAATPFADTTPAAAPKTGKAVDTGAAMAVLFAQPAPQAHAASAPAAAAAPVAERVLDMGSDDAWIAQLAADIAATKSQEGDISFRLMPRHLGRLDVAMTSSEGGVSVKLDTQHEATATLVHAAQGKLVDDLRQQGVRVTGAEVTCTPGETGRQSQGQSQGRSATPDAAHLIETATAEHAEPRADTTHGARAADRRGRFA